MTSVGDHARFDEADEPHRASYRFTIDTGWSDFAPTDENRRKAEQLISLLLVDAFGADFATVSSKRVWSEWPT